jgi:hypothetical protein
MVCTSYWRSVVLLALAAVAVGGRAWAEAGAKATPATKARQLDASEIALFGGEMRDIRGSEHSFSWELQYMQSLGGRAAASFGWLNEGHRHAHSRDGFSTQLWLRDKPFGDRLTLAAGVGPYFYSDTAWSLGPGNYTNDHGLGALLSLDAGWELSERWRLHLRGNYVVADAGQNTKTVNLGLGYLLPDGEEPPQGADGSSATWRKREEVSVMLGSILINNFRQDRSTAKYIEYRHSFARHLDWSVGFLDEGDAPTLNRNGLVTQAWAVRDLADGAWSLGLGLGPYWAVDSRRDGEAGAKAATVCGVLSMSAAHRMNDRWSLRGEWSRVLTTYDRDTDVLLLGVGYSLKGAAF